MLKLILGSVLVLHIPILNTLFKIYCIQTNFQGMKFSQTIEISGFIFENHLLSTLELHMHCECFEDLIFVDDKLPAKKAKITSLENLICTHTVFSIINTSGGKQMR